MSILLATLSAASATTPDAEYIDCDEFAGVGIVPIANVGHLVPSDYTVVEPVPGFALVVAQAGTCDEILVNGRFGRPATFAQFGIGVVPPSTPGNGDFYQILFATDHLPLAAKIWSAGGNARFTPTMTYTLTPTTTPDEATLFVDVPRPFLLAWELGGVITLPDPADPPQPLTTFNYWAQGPFGFNNLQQNEVTGIRFGDGTGVTLTTNGMGLENLVGGTTLAFPFFSNPESFDRADVSILRDVF